MRSAFFTVLALMAGVAYAHCPNGCSGHGTCGSNDICTCFQDWQGGDCSLRTCAYDLAFVDTPTAADTAHYYAECSNKGICDRTKGECTCFDGYEGKACRRTSCPNECSGHGVCDFIEELGSDTHLVRVVDPATRAGASNPTYLLWDHQKTRGCACDPGWEGADCSLRACPNGDDPLTTSGQNTMVQLVSLGVAAASLPAAGGFVLTYRDPYGAMWSTGKIAAVTSTTAATVATDTQAALRLLPNRALDSVTVAATTSASVAVLNAGRTAQATAVDCSAVVCVLVTFPNEPGTTGVQFPMSCDGSDRTTSNYGWQPVSAGLGATCAVYEQATYVSMSYGENARCSNRGICDQTTGLCECFQGFRGLACENQDALV